MRIPSGSVVRGRLARVHYVAGQRFDAHLVAQVGQRAGVGVVQTRGLARRAVVAAELDHRRVAEAAFLGGHVAFEVFAYALVVRVRRREPHSTGDPVDVRVDRKDAAATAREQQDAVGRLRPDAVEIQEGSAHLVGVARPDELVEGRFAAVLLADPLG